jgi:hypothetical protein
MTAPITDAALAELERAADAWDASRLDGGDGFVTARTAYRQAARPEVIRALIGRLRAAEAAPMARPLEEWHEEDGDVLWWRFPAYEAPYVGSPLASDWPDYHTHWTPLGPLPAPRAEVG